MYLHKSKARVTILAIVAILLMALLAPAVSYASPVGNRNTAIGLAGLSAVLFANGKTVPGVIAAAGAGIALNRAAQERREEVSYRYYRPSAVYPGYGYYNPAPVYPGYGYYGAPSFSGFIFFGNQGRFNDHDRDDHRSNRDRDDHRGSDHNRDRGGDRH